MAITGKIDVLKIDKTKLFKGTKGTYLDIVLIETPGDQYGNDYLIVQSVSKEERAAGKRGAILGNAKLMRRAGEPQGAPPAQAPAKAPPITLKSESDDGFEPPF